MFSMNKRFESPDFCSTLDGLLPKLRRPHRSDPLAKVGLSSKDENAKPRKGEKQNPKRDKLD